MSKSKGNILDPLDLIDGVDLDTLLKKRTEGLMQPSLQGQIERSTRKEFPEGIAPFGTDAVRLTFASLVSTGRDVRFDLSRTDGFHRFCNKLWNASAYVLSQTANVGSGPTELSAADRWIRARLARAIREVHEGFASYRLDQVAQTLYDFAWHELCDWYLELTKAVLTDPDADPALRRGAQTTLLEVLGALLKLLHPLIPFVTEEIWLELCRHTGASSDTIMLERMPEPGDFAEDAEAAAEIEWVKGFVVGIRQIRGDSNLARSIQLSVQLADASDSDRERVARHAAHLRKLGGLEKIELVAGGAPVKGAATALLGAMRILVPLAGLIDVASERDRLGKQLAKARDDASKSRRKLDNQSFVANAPAEIVAKEQARIAELEQRAAQLEQQLARLAELG
jgi:valyl-tRNA synthetase